MEPIKFSDTNILFYIWIGYTNGTSLNYTDIKDVIEIKSSNFLTDYLGGNSGTAIN